MKNSEGKTSQ